MSATAAKVTVVGTTLRVTVAVVVAPSRSVAETLSVWVPTERLGTTTAPPVPRAPSRLELQRMAAARSPSSASVAVAARSTGFPVRREVPFAGAAMETAGGAFGGRTTTVRSAWPVRPPRSVADAVMTCVPALRRVVVKLAPEPMSPSRSDVQRSDAERLPSVASLAVPLKARLVPAKTVVPSAGPVIATTGGVGVTVRRTCAEPVAPSESVTEAVRTWVPSESVTVRVPPPPSAPSRLDAHWILLVTLPSKSSVAVAPSITVLPAGAEAPSAGAPIVTTGATLGSRTRMLTWAWPRCPSLSVAAAVMTCVPTLSVLVLIVAPVPRAPSRLDVHWIWLDRSPSVTSFARPASVIVSLWKRTAPSAGELIVTLGGLPATVTTSFGAGPPSRER